MSFRLVPKSVTLNDVERRNGPYFWVISPNSVASGAHCVKIAEGAVVKKFTFASSSSDKCLVMFITYGTFFTFLTFFYFTTSLWPPYGIGQAIIFSSCGFSYSFFFFLLLFFLTYSQPSHIGCLPYFHTWCGLSANLRCRSETCCTQLTENTGRKKSPKKSPSGHHSTTLSGYIFYIFTFFISAVLVVWCSYFRSYKLFYTVTFPKR